MAFRQLSPNGKQLVCLWQAEHKRVLHYMDLRDLSPMVTPGTGPLDPLDGDREEMSQTAAHCRKHIRCSKSTCCVTKENGEGPYSLAAYLHFEKIISILAHRLSRFCFPFLEGNNLKHK